MELQDLKDVIIKVPTADKETTVRQLLDLMTHHGADIVPVVEGNTVLGTVTEKDLLHLIRAQPIASIGAVLVKEMPKHIEGHYVTEVMTRNPLIVSPAADVEDTIKKMAASDVRFVIVVDSGKLLGVARLRDILKKYYSFR